VLIALAIAECGDERSQPRRASDGAHSSRAAQLSRADRGQIRDVIRRFTEAALAGDTVGMCALVIASKLRYLEQFGLPCEVSLGGRLTADRSATSAAAESPASISTVITRSLTSAASAVGATCTYTAV
jgi:hypothetical protein